MPIRPVDVSLVCSFEPIAIREHYEESEVIQNLTDEQLRQVGEWAILDDSLWRLFDQLLEGGLREVLGLEPGDYVA